MRRGTLVLLLIVTVPLFAASKRRSVSPDRCTEILAPATVSFPANGGSATVNVTVNGGCTWSPVVSDAWLTATQSGNTVNVTASPNSATTPRTAFVHVRSSIVVTQDATTNLVQNGSFDNDISGWTTEFSVGVGSATWSGGGGIIVAPPASPQGAAQITWQQAGPNGGAGYQLDQCVPISGNTRYTAGAKALIPPGQGGGVVTFGIYEYWNSGCAQHGTFGYHGFQNRQSGSPVGQWFDITPVSWTSDPNARSVLVVIGAGGSPAPPFTAYFDDVYIRPAQ